MSQARLRRELGLGGAVMLGLGSMIGTGVFVSVGLAAGVAGPAVILAVGLAAGVAVFNGLSSAQLAASHPVAGGTYEYGYVYLNSWLGFSAGWVFLLAKSASAATAALGLAGYSLQFFAPAGDLQIPLALAAVAGLTALVLGGMRRSNRANTVIVGFSLLTLGYFVVAGLLAGRGGAANLQPFFAPGPGESGPLAALFHATALMFVAYTGYARIATLGEEVRRPARTIPRAIVLVMGVTLALYALVTLTAVRAVGAEALSQATAESAAPLSFALAELDAPFGPTLLTLGALTALLGVLLNLILGLSRVLLAMGRRGDMPAFTAKLNAAQTTPPGAVLLAAAGVGGLVLIGDVRATWTFSAFTVLIYYSLTNLAALRLPAEKRRFPAWMAAAGLLSCLFLAFWVDVRTWLLGLGLILVGLVWHAAARRLSKGGRDGQGAASSGSIEDEP
ncbi:MAG: APC family permease [Candidatus Promineifilaceae bacterium]